MRSNSSQPRTITRKVHHVAYQTRIWVMCIETHINVIFSCMMRSSKWRIFFFFFTKFLSTFLVSSVQAVSYRPFLKSLITDAILTRGTVGRVILMCVFVWESIWISPPAAMSSWSNHILYSFFMYYTFDCTVTLKFCCMYMRCTLKVMERQLGRLSCGPVLRLFISMGSLWLNRNFLGNPVKKRTFWVQKKKRKPLET